MHAHKKSRPVAQHTLRSNNLTSVCAIDFKGSFSHLGPRKRVHFLLPYLLTALHDSITGIVTRLVRLETFSQIRVTLSPDSTTTMGHPDGAGFCAVKDIDWAGASIISCAGRLSSSRSLRFVGEDDDDV